MDHRQALANQICVTTPGLKYLCFKAWCVQYVQREVIGNVSRVDWQIVADVSEDPITFFFSINTVYTELRMSPRINVNSFSKDY